VCLLSAQEKNATVFTPILCPPPRLLSEYRRLITLATLLLSVQIATLLFARRGEVASLADAVLSGRWHHKYQPESRDHQ
jgi:hypothetical protein